MSLDLFNGDHNKAQQGTQQGPPQETQQNMESTLTPVRKILRNAAAPLGLIGAVGGFIGDVISPLIDLAPWVAAISFAIALIALVIVLWFHRQPGRQQGEQAALGVLVVSVCGALIFGVWSLILANAPPRGYLAENVEPIAQLQASVLGIQQDVADIKQTTTQTAQQVQEIATAQASNFNQLQASFAALLGKGDVVPNPSTPQEWYANARVYQLKGDTANAIKSFEGYFPFKLDYVDPFVEYANLIKATEGLARAREAIGRQQQAQPGNPSAELVYITLQDSAEDRLKQLQDLAARLPNFAPVYRELSREYTTASITNFSPAMVTQEGEALDTLFALEQQQGFSRYYIDKAAAEHALQEARTRQTALAAVLKTFSQAEIRVDFFPNGARFTLNSAEVGFAQKLMFSIDSDKLDQDAGKSAAGTPNATFGPVPVPVGEHIIYARFTDQDGKPGAVLSKTFTVAPIAVNVIQQPKDFSTNAIPALVTVGVTGASANVPVTYTYSIDTPTLDQTATGLDTTGSFILADVKAGEHTLHIQATTTDGKQSEVVAVPFKINE